ncbi:MAG TPA: hypothetical protein PL193_15885 [Xanthobacteraceae bacterium]|nr:hypothetical protein [Xanthobacteraceae bacterium]
MADTSAETVWLPVIAKALCFMCMHAQGVQKKTVLEKVQFLESLGLSRAQAAEVAGSTAASVAELKRRAKSSGVTRGKKKKKKTAKRR